MEENICGNIEGTILTSAWRNCGQTMKTLVRIVCVPADIKMGHLLNRRLMCYCFSQLAWLYSMIIYTIMQHSLHKNVNIKVLADLSTSKQLNTDKKYFHCKPVLLSRCPLSFISSLQLDTHSIIPLSQYSQFLQIADYMHSVTITKG